MHWQLGPGSARPWTQQDREAKIWLESQEHAGLGPQGSSWGCEAGGWGAHPEHSRAAAISGGGGQRRPASPGLCDGPWTLHPELRPGAPLSPRKHHAGCEHKPVDSRKQACSWAGRRGAAQTDACTAGAHTPGLGGTPRNKDPKKTTERLGSSYSQETYIFQLGEGGKTANSSCLWLVLKHICFSLIKTRRARSKRREPQCHLLKVLFG